MDTGQALFRKIVKKYFLELIRLQLVELELERESKTCFKCIACCSTCITAADTAGLESALLDCFSEAGEWVLDLFCGSRQLSRAALQSGRSALALTPDPAELDQLAALLRPASRQLESQYRDTDGLVLELPPAQ